MRTLTKSAPTFAVGGHLPRAGDPSLTKRVFSRRLGQRVRIRSSIRTLDSRTNTRTRRTSHTGWQMHRHLAGLGAALYASRGPVVRVKEDDAWSGLMLAIETVAERTGAIFLRVSPGIRQDFALHDRLLGHGFRHLPDDWTTWNAPRIVLHLDLDSDEAELYRRVRKTTRQEGASARRRGVVVRPARDPADLTRLHRLLVAMGNAKGYPVRGVERLRQLWAKYVARGQGVLLVAEHDGDMIGGLLAARFGARAYFQYATVKRGVD